MKFKIGDLVQCIWVNHEEMPLVVIRSSNIYTWVKYHNGTNCQFYTENLEHCTDLRLIVKHLAGQASQDDNLK